MENRTTRSGHNASTTAKSGRVTSTRRKVEAGSDCACGRKGCDCGSTKSKSNARKSSKTEASKELKPRTTSRKSTTKNCNCTKTSRRSKSEAGSEVGRKTTSRTSTAKNCNTRKTGTSRTRTTKNCN